MLGPLPQSMSSFSRNSKTTVQSLVRDMKADKQELFSAIAKLSNFSSGSSFAAAKVAPFSLLDRQILLELFRDSSLRVQKFFTAMNGVGVALNSMVSIFTAEIEKVEKDIENLELFINNYEFISGKDDLYNYSYIERFSDFLSDYRSDGSNFKIPDRDNTDFPTGGNGFIDSSVGVFKFGSEIRPINVLNRIRSIDVFSNYDNYVTTNGNPANLFNENLLDSWNVTIKSPTILTSNLSKYVQFLPYDTSTYNGAQTVIDVTFTEAIMMDTVRLSPNTGSDFLLMQVVLFSDSNNASTNLLASPISLSKFKEILFTKQLVSRIIFIFNQSSYTRSKSKSITSELNSKALDLFVQERIDDRRKKFSRYQDMVYWHFLRKTVPGKIARNRTEYDFYSYKFPVEIDLFNKLISEEIFVNSNFGLDYKYSLNRSSIFLSLVQNVFRALSTGDRIISNTNYIESFSSTGQRLLEYAGFMYGNNSSVFDAKDQFYKFPIQGGGVAEAIQSMLTEESPDMYEYLFSLRSIDFAQTTSSSVDKACFVSKRIPANSQVTALKAKIDGVEATSGTSVKGYDLTSLASYELSVSNSESPVNESNWYPLAFNDQPSIESEVVFFDISDYSAKLRFNPIQDSIMLYRDGILISNFTYNPVINKITLTNPSIYSPSNTFCVKYDLDLIQYKPYEIDFVKNNLIDYSIRTFGDASGEGQKFSRTDINNSVTLDYSPYVNLTLAKNSYYSSSIGTVFTADASGYSPVKVLLSDGSYAINLTNYTGVPQNVQLYNSREVTFIQNGKNIVFNTNVNTPFSVRYDYMANSLRFRFVARKNIPNVDVPIRIDNVILKMKTVNFDPYYDKLNLSTAGR